MVNGLFEKKIRVVPIFVVVEEKQLILLIHSGDDTPVLTVLTAHPDLFEMLFYQGGGVFSQSPVDYPCIMVKLGCSRRGKLNDNLLALDFVHNRSRPLFLAGAPAGISWGRGTGLGALLAISGCFSILISTEYPTAV